MHEGHPMSVVNDYAFPTHFSGQSAAQHGLTKRELFAAMAIQGLMSHPEDGTLMPSQAASWAVKYADAMIFALSGQQP